MELVWAPTLVVGQEGPAAEPPDDAALMAAYRGGDGQAFETLYRRHRAPLYRFIARQLRDRGEAEEVFQEVWMAVVKGRERYRPSARFLTFLFAIAHRRIADRARKAVRRPQAPMPEDAPELATRASCALEAWDDKRATQEADGAFRSGTSDWRDCDVVMQIPDNATRVRVRYYLRGGGKVWSDGFRIEEVGAGVPETHRANSNMDRSLDER